MVQEARLKRLSSGVAPTTEGWFVVNVRDAAWLTHETFGRRSIFESDGRMTRERPDFKAVPFEHLGVKLAVVQPGQPSTMYHAETAQEGFLVLAGECLLLVEDEERRMRAWDFFHCPGGTAHAFVGAGDRPCVILMVGARPPEGSIVYRVSELARRHGAGVEEETDDPNEAYRPFGHWRLGRPATWEGLPW